MSSQNRFLDKKENIYGTVTFITINYIIFKIDSE